MLAVQEADVWKELQPQKVWHQLLEQECGEFSDCKTDRLLGSVASEERFGYGGRAGRFEYSDDKDRGNHADQPAVSWQVKVVDRKILSAEWPYAERSGKSTDGGR